MMQWFVAHGSNGSQLDAQVLGMTGMILRFVGADRSSL